jgi:hypothetical protein
MGVLSDLVVARADEAERVSEAVAPSQTFEGIDIKGVDSVKFSRLHSILVGRSVRELMPLYQPVVIVSEEGPWVFQIPQDLVARLAALDDVSRTDVSRRWALAEEFVLDRWGEDDVASALSSISSLAKRAFDSERALFLWMSL